MAIRLDVRLSTEIGAIEFIQTCVAGMPVPVLCGFLTPPENLGDHE
tara:strand:+ start:365 stop:502 length:138 start_codon:yes stop_codon:yes gene_type:complete